MWWCFQKVVLFKISTTNSRSWNALVNSRTNFFKYHQMDSWGHVKLRWRQLEVPVKCYQLWYTWTKLRFFPSLKQCSRLWQRVIHHNVRGVSVTWIIIWFTHSHACTPQVNFPVLHGENFIIRHTVPNALGRRIWNACNQVGLQVITLHSFRAQLN